MDGYTPKQCLFLIDEGMVPPAAALREVKAKGDDPSRKRLGTQACRNASRLFNRQLQ